MSKALQKLKGRERPTVDNLVHCFVCADLEQGVDGMKGFFDYYMKKVATADQRRQWSAFHARVQEVRTDMLRMMKQEGWGEEE